MSDGTKGVPSDTGFESSSRVLNCELRHEEQLFQVQAGRDDMAGEPREIVTVGAGDSFDESVQSQAFEDAANLGAGLAGEVAPEILVLESADVELPAGDDLEEVLIVCGEEVEFSIGALVLEDGLRDLMEGTDSCAGIVESGDELQITAVGRGKNLSQGGNAVEALLHRDPSQLAGAVAVFYRSVVLEKGDVVGGGLDPEDEAEVVVAEPTGWGSGLR